MMILRPSRRLLLAIAAFALSATACATDGDTSTKPPAEDSPEATAEPAELTLMLNWVPNAHHAGIYMAEASGWYDEAGLQLTIVEPDFAVGVEAAVAQGAADVGIAQAESLLPARAAGVDVVAIATLLPTNDSVLMALASEDVTGPGSLESLSYGGFGGALETELISRLVACGGGDPSTVEYVEVGEVDYLAGLEQDQFDFVWVFGGWDALRGTEVEGVDLDVVAFEDHLDCIPDWYTPLMVAGDNRLDDPAIESFLAATARGYEAVIADPAAGAEVLSAASPETDPALIEAALAYYAPRFAPDEPWGTMEAEVWVDFADFLVEADLLEEAVDVEQVWTNDLLPE